MAALHVFILLQLFIALGGSDKLTEEECKTKFETELTSSQREYPEESVCTLHKVGYFLYNRYRSEWEEYKQWKNSESFNESDPNINVDYETLMTLISSKDIQLFDVRTVEEVEETGMMPGAANVPLSDIEEAFRLPAGDFRNRYGVDMPSKGDKNVVIHCLAGCRSLQALEMLYEAGYKRVRHYPGGWEEYTELRGNNS